MGKGIYFGGQEIIKPGVYASVNADAMVPNRLTGQNRIGVIGTALGGVPKTITKITSPVEAQNQLRGGTLLSVIQLMYDPSPDLPGAGEVHYYRLNLAVAASAAVKDAGALTVGTITAKDYGVWTNQLRYKIEAGSVSGVKISVNDVMNPTIIEVGDNLGNACTIHYTGSAAYARLSIAKTGDVATSLTLQTSADNITWTTVASLDLTNASLATLGALVAYLASVQDFTATVVGDANEPVGDLDAVTNQDVKTATYTATAHLGAVIYWLKAHSQLVTMARQAGASNAPAAVGWTFLSGGSEGSAPTNTDWQTALDTFQTDDVDLIFVCSEDAAIHAMAEAHVDFTSGIKQRMERRTICGGAAAETVAQAVARAQELDDRRVSLCYPGIKRRNLTTGLVDSLSPMYGAACVTGMAAGVVPATPLTNKTIRVSGLETVLGLTDIETLLQAGVLPFEYNRTNGDFRIVQGLTTYLTDDNVVWRKIAGVRIADYIVEQLRDATSRFVGGIGDKSTLTSIKNAIVGRLNALTRSATNVAGVITPGTDADGNPDPAFKNLSVVFDGFDLVAVTFECHPVGEIAYITITAGLTPTTIQA